MVRRRVAELGCGANVGADYQPYFCTYAVKANGTAELVMEEGPDGRKPNEGSCGDFCALHPWLAFRNPFTTSSTSNGVH